MFKRQLVAQRLIVYALLIVCAFAFIAALGYMTDVRLVCFPGINARGDKFDGAQLYNVFQPYNRELVTASLISLLASLLLLITKCHSRRNYYVTNYVVSIGIPALNAVLAIKSVSTISMCKRKFLTEVDFEKIAVLYEKDIAKQGYSNFSPSRSTFFFDMATVAFVLLLIVSVLIVLNLIWKIILMRKEKKLIGSQVEVSA